MAIEGKKNLDGGKLRSSEIIGIIGNGILLHLS